MPRICRKPRHPVLLSLFLSASTILLSCHSAARPSDMRSVSIRLERTRCFGTCPDYSVTIYGDGSIKYLGRHFVDIPGEQTAKIQADKVSELLTTFDDIHFFGLQDRYSDSCTDLPTVYISLAFDGKSKRVENYFCHQEKWGTQVDLTKLADQIDTVSGSRRWIKCDARCLKELIASGLDVNSRGPDGTTPLIAASHGANLEKVRTLLAQGAQPNVADDRGYTSLMYAAMANQPAIAQELLTHNANVNARDHRGLAALDMVAGGSEIERVLLKPGAQRKGK